MPRKKILSPREKYNTERLKNCGRRGAPSSVLDFNGDTDTLKKYLTDNNITLDLEDQKLMFLCKNMSPFEIIFSYEYVTNGFNAEQARGIALQLIPGIEPKHKVLYANKLLGLLEISHLVYYLSVCKIKTYLVKPENILKELAVIGFSDITKFFDINYNTLDIKLKDFAELGIMTRAIKDIKIKPTFRKAPDGSFFESKSIELTLHSKLNALELLAKNLGLLEAKFENSNTSSDDIQKGFETLAKAIKSSDLATSIH